MGELILLTGSHDPWQAWNSSILDQIEKCGIKHRNLVVENDITTSELPNPSDLYFARTNSPRAQTLCAHIYFGGGRIINGMATTYTYPRISLLTLLARHGLRIPRHYYGYNLSSLFNVIPPTLYPIIRKSVGSLLGEVPKLIHTKEQMLDVACKWSVGALYPHEPFYFEEYLGDEVISVKVYVIGEHIICSRRFEGYSEKLISQAPEIFELPIEIEHSLRTILQKYELNIVSIDMLLDPNNVSNWYVIDVNLVPMFATLNNAPILISDVIIQTLK